MNKTKIQEVEFVDVEVAINNKLKDFIDKYNQYPQYIKLPLWISNYMKQSIPMVTNLKIDYNDGFLRYRNLIICETISISQLEEIEVF
jgi:hypothetical protein